MGRSRLALIPRWRSFCLSAFFRAPVFFFGILYQVKFSYVFSFIWTKSWATWHRCNKLLGDPTECKRSGEIVWRWIKKPLTAETRNATILVPSLLAFWSGHGQNKGVFAVLSDNFQLERLEDLNLLVLMGQEYGYHLGSSLNLICNHHQHHHHHQSLLYLALLSRKMKCLEYGLIPELKRHIYCFSGMIF